MTPTPPAPGAGPVAAAGSTQVGLVACRGCCCGSPEKKPDIAHDARLERLHRFADSDPSAVTVRTSACLGPCEYADVVVVRPSAAGRHHGGRPVWFGFLDDHALGRLQGWIATGGPGLAAVPDDLQLHEINRPRPETRRGTGGNI